MQILTLTFFFFFLIAFIFAIPLKRFPKVYSWYILLISLAFYATWSIPLLGFLLSEIVIIYLILFKSVKKGRVSSVRYLTTIISITTIFWLIFKFSGFYVQSLQELLSQLGLIADDFALKAVTVLGISFFSFRLISASVLITQKKIRLPSFSEFAAYIAFFPQISSGPVMTLPEFTQDIRAPKRNYSRSKVGISIMLGLFKKYILSSYLYDFISDPFLHPAGYSSNDLLLAAVAYSAYIYVDFSGYTDLSNGISNLLGFRTIENFNVPYLAKSVADFWRRWHITLGRWLKYHLYIPLGGSQKGLLKKYRNLMIVMTFSGIWHGAGINFAIWGGLHGIGIVVGDFVGRIMKWLSERLPKVIVIFLTPFTSITAWAFTLSFVILARIIFRTADLDTAILYFQTLFAPTNMESTMVLQWRELVYLFIAYLMSTTEVSVRIWFAKILDRLPWIFLFIFLCLMLAIIVTLSPSSMPPFLYYKF